MEKTLQNFEVTGTRLLLKKIAKNSEKVKHNLLVSSEANSAPVEAEVVKVGQGVFHNGTFLGSIFNVGDIVLVPAYANQEAEIEDQKYLIVGEQEVYGRFTGV
jgi:co-chaperonin GroES (HSP10)